jgi:pimeloyl-ACP methyl ester carboxylesterase
MEPTIHRAKPTFRKRCLRGVLICGTVYLLAGIGCASCQRKLMYFPPILTTEKEDELGRSQGLERWNSSSGKPLGWKRVSPVQPARGQVLITHGNACCAVQCPHYADVIQHAAAFDVFIVEYPGYGDREGSPSLATLEESAKEAFQLLPTNSPVYLVGESLGTGVAAYLAGCFPRVAGLALLAPYNNLTDVAQAHIRIFPVRWMLCDRFPAEDYLRDYRGPLAVVVGGRDTVVPQKFGRRLYDGYAGRKRLWEFPNSDHDQLMFQPVEVWREIVGFWQSDPHSSEPHRD